MNLEAIANIVIGIGAIILLAWIVVVIDEWRNP